MCNVTIYRNRIEEINVVMDGVYKYRIDLEKGELVAYTLIGKRRTFEIGNIKRVKWSSEDDSLVIKGRIEEIVERQNGN